MSQKAKITVYLQALGAHFLGAHAYKVEEISVKLIYSERSIPLSYLLNQNSNDGIPTTVFTPGVSSFMPIMTVQQENGSETAVHFLSSDPLTICGCGEFDLPGQMEYAHLEMDIPVTSSSTPVRIGYPVLLNPTQSEYIIPVAVPGLYLSPNSIAGTLSVFVKMMCGCPVTMGPPASLWPANDFTVFANVYDTSGKRTAYQLGYDESQTGNSLFSAPLPISQNTVRSVTFTAIQKSTGNYGSVVQDQAKQS